MASDKKVPWPDHVQSNLDAIAKAGSVEKAFSALVEIAESARLAQARKETDWWTPAAVLATQYLKGNQDIGDFQRREDTPVPGKKWPIRGVQSLVHDEIADRSFGEMVPSKEWVDGCVDYLMPILRNARS